MLIRRWFITARIFSVVAIYAMIYVIGQLNELTTQRTSKNVLYEQKSETYNTDWLQKRKELQLTSSHKKVLLFCYMRGGSSFFSQLFDQNEDCMFWYEIISAFYMATYGLKKWVLPHDIFWYQHQQGNVSKREIPLWEHNLLSEFNHNLMNCKFNELPIEALTHPGYRFTTMNYLKECFIKQFGARIQKCFLELPNCKRNITSAIKNECAKKINLWKKYVETKDAKFIENEFLRFAQCRNVKALNCLQKFEEKCQKSKIVAYKGLRLTMSSVKFMLEKDPDMQILYFVRDPRAIASSRTRSDHWFIADIGKDPVIETKYLCKKMMHDYLVYKEILVKYPGAIKLIRYEDLVNDRYRYLYDIYRFIGEEVHPSVLQWTRENLRGKVSAGLRKTVVKNSVALIDKWKKKTTITQQEKMTSNCKEILDILGYK